MKKKSILTTIIVLLIAVFALSLTACDNGSNTLESLQNEYGIALDGGSFEKGSTLVSNEIAATTKEATAVLSAIADQNYNKAGRVYIFDIYVMKDGTKVQPNGKVKVSIPVPNLQADNYLVFHVKADNSVETLVSTVADGKISFETSSFSYFVIAEAAPAVHVHTYGDWTFDQVTEGKHIRECKCGEVETADCTFDDGVVTKEPTHYEEGVKTFTCTVCGGQKSEPIAKTTEHEWTEWAPDNDGKTHTRLCKCGASETKDHTFDAGTVTKEPTHLETGVKKFTCADCGFIREDVLNKTPEHTLGKWKPLATVSGKHYRECACGEQETADCAWDAGVVTKEPTHYEEGVKTFTCTVCGGQKTEPIAKTAEHEWSDWYSNQNGTHSRSCACNEVETKDCTYDNGVVTEEPTHVEPGTKLFTCTVCGHTYEEEIPTTPDHEWGEWVINKLDETNTHIRFCICNESQTAPHNFDNGVVTEPATHMTAGVKTFTCTDCGYSYTEEIPKTTDHEWSDWSPNGDGTHTRACGCNANETNDCSYDNGVVTEEPTHVEPGTKLFTCTVCGHTYEEEIPTTPDHEWGEWVINKLDETNTHIRFCICNESQTAPHNFDNGVVTEPATHMTAGVKTFTCTDCGYSYTEEIPKTTDHEWSDWYSNQNDTHSRSCPCNEVETKDCTYANGVVTKQPTHLEEGVKTYTCTICGQTKEEPLEKTPGHSFGDWKPDEADETKHYHECACGEKETANCSFDEGVVTKEPTHLEEGVKTYTCTVCGRTKTDSIEKTPGHSFGDWKPDEVDDTKHYKQCGCGQVETADCTFEDDVCTVCGREKSGETEDPEVEGIIIVIAGGTATFEGKETVTAKGKLYGENATVYIAQENDVLNVTLNDQDGRTFKYWVSATGTIIPDEDFSLLVFRSGYYYPVFEDTDTSAFSTRVKIFEGNCEEGILYMSTNSKGDIKYELEFVNFGHHDFYESVYHNSLYHKQVCSICGETIFEEHTEYDREIEKEAGHTEEGLMRYECFCGHVWTEAIPVTDEHTIDYDDWHIVEESKNGQYGKYRVYCKYCDYYEEYWYLGGLDFVSFIDGKMIHYQYTYGGKVSHDEYYYSYRNAEGKKVYIWAFQYEYEYSSNADYNDTYIFMYVDDEDPTTLEPVYLSKSKGDRKAAYLWAIYGYVYDVNGWIDLLDYPDRNIGCSGGMSMGNSMSARSSVLESYHDQWAETYNKLRIPTSKAYDDLSGTPWEIDWEGKSFTGGYYDENDEYVTVGGRDVISFVKDAGTSYTKYMYVDKETGITYGYADYGTAYRTVFIMKQYKTIVSPEEFEKLDDAGKSVSYSYGDIEKDIKSLCAERNAFNNFTLTVPKEASAFRLSVDFMIDDLVDMGGYYANVYYNTAQVFDSGSYITFTWTGGDDLVFDRYEIWDFANQKWVVLSESPDFTFNTSDNPRREAAYIRVIYHKVDLPADPEETYTITIENGYFEIDGKEYTGTIQVPANTLVYPYANEVSGKTFDHWVDGNGEEFNDYYFYVTSDMVLTPVYVDAMYRVYCEGWNYDSYVSINGGEMHYTDEFEGKAGDTVQLNTTYNPEYGCTVFIGWYLESYGKNGHEYILVSDKQAFTYTITGEEQGCLYAVWTTGENPFVKKYVNIRVVNGFVNYAGGEAGFGMLDNAYSAISLSNSGRVRFFDDPTDETVYTAWDIAYRYELEGEVVHDIVESFENEYDYYPAEYWVDSPEYSYPDGVINVTGIDASSGN